MTELPMKAKVSATDGPAGVSKAVIIDPVRQNVTHVVVETDHLGELTVPIENVTATDHDSITLDLSLAEMETMMPFKEIRYIEGVPIYPEFQGGGWEAPYVTIDYGTEPFEVEKLPPGELAVHRGDSVLATDGRVGEVGEFVVDPDDGHISHIVLQKGHLWGKREVTVPLKMVDRVEESAVYLSVDKDAIDDLPAVKVKRHYRGG